MGPVSDLFPVLGVLVAALGGAAIGIERERSGHASGVHAHFGGVRTFTLLGGAAGLAGLLYISGYTGVAVGDFVVCGESTSTASVSLSCLVTAANVVSVYKVNNSGASVVVPTSTIYATVFPRASFGVPAAIATVTSTSN